MVIIGVQSDVDASRKTVIILFEVLEEVGMSQVKKGWELLGRENLLTKLKSYKMHSILEDTIIHDLSVHWMCGGERDRDEFNYYILNVIDLKNKGDFQQSSNCVFVLSIQSRCFIQIQINLP